jgi:dienelactone hydrolase
MVSCAAGAGGVAVSCRAMHTEFIEYADGKTTCEGYLVYDATIKGKRPAVVVSHAWAGQTHFERKKAEWLAQLGYVGFALDLYGKGMRGTTMEQNATLMQPFVDDRAMLKQRIIAGVSAIKQHMMVDGHRIGAIGFCFGGMCVLDLARAVVPGVQGVVSIHGMFHPPKLGKQEKITTKILALHGFDDPMVPPDQMVALGRELDAAGADWQLHAFGNTMHAFTNPEMKFPEKGLQYSKTADQRTWVEVKYFFEEVFG